MQTLDWWCVSGGRSSCFPDTEHAFGGERRRPTRSLLRLEMSVVLSRSALRGVGGETSFLQQFQGQRGCFELLYTSPCTQQRTSVTTEGSGREMKKKQLLSEKRMRRAERKETSGGLEVGNLDAGGKKAERRADRPRIAVGILSRS